MSRICRSDSTSGINSNSVLADAGVRWRSVSCAYDGAWRGERIECRRVGRLGRAPNSVGCSRPAFSWRISGLAATADTYTQVLLGGVELDYANLTWRRAPCSLVMRAVRTSSMLAYLSRQGAAHLWDGAGRAVRAFSRFSTPTSRSCAGSWPGRRAGADRRLRPRDRRHHRGDRATGEGGRPRRGPLPDPRLRPLHRDARDRRGRRHHPLPQRPPPLRLGRAHPDRAQLRRQGPPRPHLRTGSPALRWALVEAAQHTPTGSGPLRVAYERIAKRRGKQVAKVAVARKILTLCYYGLRDGEIRCLAPRAKARTIRTTAVAR